MKEIKLTQGKVALVDDVDYEWINSFKWHVTRHANGKEYASRMIYNRGKRAIISMHRLIMGTQIGQEVDHIDNLGLNNQRANLRNCNRSQNNINSHRANGTSKFKGVYWYGPRNKWRAKIKINRVCIHLGYFVLETDAAMAYDKKALELYGSFAKLNIINRTGGSK
jgi:hypothetical protein